MERKNFRIRRQNSLNHNLSPETVVKCSSYKIAVEKLQTINKWRGYDYWIEGKIGNEWYGLA